MQVEEAFRSRRSVRSFEPSATLDDATLARLFELVALSPSSFNLQHWRFVVARETELKLRLKEAAMGQPQVAEASAVVLVLGKLSAFADAERIYAELDPERRARTVKMIHGFYEGNVEAQRDEALRSGSMGAMALMLAAQSLGLSSGPMIGFDKQRVCALLGVDDAHIPVMLIALGRQKNPPPPRQYRRPLREIVTLDGFKGPGLA